MWMSSYLQETLVRDQLAEARQRAAQHRLARLARTPRAPSGTWKRLWRRLRASVPPAPALLPHMKGQ